MPAFRDPYGRRPIDFPSVSGDAYGIRAAVLDAFPGYTQKFEGRIPYMYLDMSDLPGGPFVTTGVGNLADPVSLALAMPWVHKSDNTTPATADEITAEWNLVKSHPELAPKGAQAFASMTQLRLTSQSIDALVQQKVAQNEVTLFARYPNLPLWPADAQLALLSLSWAMGPAFNFPAFKVATDALDFSTAGLQAIYKGVGSAPRQAAHKVLFANAAAVVKQGLDPEVLYYPNQAPGVVVSPRANDMLSAWASLFTIAAGAATLYTVFRLEHPQSARKRAAA